MAVRGRLVALLGVGALAAVGTAVPATPAAAVPATPAAAAAVPTVLLPTNLSVTAPLVGALSRGPAGTVFRLSGPDGVNRSMLLRTGATTPEALPGSHPHTPALLQGDVVMQPGDTAVTFRSTAGAVLGSVPLGPGEFPLTGAGPGSVLLSVTAAEGGSRLVRRTPGAADVVMAGGARFIELFPGLSDPAGMLLRVATGANSGQDTRTLVYLHFATGRLTDLVTGPKDRPVQGAVLEGDRVGWIDGATLSTTSRTAPGPVTTRTLPVSTAQLVSGSTVAWLQPDPEAVTSAHLMVRRADDPTTRDLGRLAAYRDYKLPSYVIPSVLPDGAGGFLFPVGEPGMVGLRSTDGRTGTTVWSAPRQPAVVSDLAISGGRVTYRDEAAHGTRTWSHQLVAGDGAPRLATPRPVPVGPAGASDVQARGSRTLLTGPVGPTSLPNPVGVFALFGGGTQLRTDPRAGMVEGNEVTGWDGVSVLHAPPAFTQTLTDLRTGVSTALTAPATADLDGGFLWGAGTRPGEVVKLPYGGGPAVTVLPPDPGCGFPPSVEARQGDVLVRCAGGARIHGPTGQLLYTFSDRLPSRSLWFGSGILWRVLDRDGVRTLTATAYRTPGATPVDIFPVPGDRPFAVDREGPWAARVTATGQIEVALVPGVPVPPVAGRYTPVAPFRLLDTRTTGGPVTAGTDRSVPVAGVGGIPPSVTDVAVSVTVTAPTSSSWLSVHPDGRYGGSSTLNFTGGQTVTTGAVVPVRNGRIALRVGGGSAQVLLDVTGFHAGVEVPASSAHVPVPPSRLLDTRSGAPVTTTPRQVRLAGVAGVPADARAVVVNATVVTPAAAGRLSAGPSSSATPTTVSYQAGRTTAAQTVLRLDAGQAWLRLGSGSAHVLLDVTGYVPAAADPDRRQADWYATAPTRLLDTRTAGGPVAAGADRRVPVAGLAGVPRGATAVFVTATATRPTSASHLTAYPSGTAPATSTLNFPAGGTVANSALVPIAPDGSISLRVGAGTAHVLLDVGGYLQR